MAEGFVERQIREAQARGEFSGLPGEGKPIPGLDERDELWWVKRKLAEESADFLPPTLAVRKERDLVLDRVRATTDEAAARRLLGALNERIREVNRLATSGPPSTLAPLDVDDAVARWRAGEL